MKRFLAISFAITSLLKPGLVLCVEAGGDVRVERPAAICCTTETAATPLSLESAAFGDCHGCLDFGLATHSLLSKRTGAADVSAASATLSAFVNASPSATISQVIRRSYASFHSVSSTTVLRR